MNNLLSMYEMTNEEIEGIAQLVMHLDTQMQVYNDVSTSYKPSSINLEIAKVRVQLAELQLENYKEKIFNNIGKYDTDFIT